MINLGINGLSGSTSGQAASVQKLAGALNTTQQINAENVSSLDTITLTNRKVPDTARALRTLSDASSLVSIAQDAAKEVKSLLGSAEEISVTLQGSLLPEQKTSLESELDSIFSRIDSIATDTEFNDETIVDSGSQTVVVDTSPTDNTSNNIISVSIPDLAISRSSLDISSLTGASVSSAPETSEDTIEAAIDSVETVIQGLSLARADIVEGVSRLAGQEFASQGFGIAEAENLVDNLAQTIEKTSNLASFQPDSLQVEELISS